MNLSSKGNIISKIKTIALYLQHEKFLPKSNKPVLFNTQKKEKKILQHRKLVCQPFNKHVLFIATPSLFIMKTSPVCTYHEHSELDKAARDMAHEAVNVSGNGSLDYIGAGVGGLSTAAGEEANAPKVSLGRIVFRGEKFFWR